MSVSSGPSPAAEHRTVARVMVILELVLASEHGMRLADLSSAIDAPKSSVHGLAKGLVATGYLREEGGRYVPGPAISTLIAAGPSTLPAVYHHALEHLTSAWNETSMLATLVGDSLVYLDSVEPDTLVRAAPRLNRRQPLWPRSAGRCFLAFMDPRRLDAHLRKMGLPPDKEADIRNDLEQVRESRVGFNFGESISDHIGIASPIILGEGTVTMAIAIAGPRARMEKQLDAMTEDLRSVVDGLSSRQPAR